MTRAYSVVFLGMPGCERDAVRKGKAVMMFSYDRFDFTDDGQYFRVLVLKIGRVRIASYSNRLWFSVWRAKCAPQKKVKKAAEPIAFRPRVSYN